MSHELKGFSISNLDNMPLIVGYIAKNYGEFTLKKNRAVRVIRHELSPAYRVTVTEKPTSQLDGKMKVSVRAKTFKIQIAPAEYDRTFLFEAVGYKYPGDAPTKSHVTKSERVNISNTTGYLYFVNDSSIEFHMQPPRRCSADDPQGTRQQRASLLQPHMFV